MYIQVAVASFFDKDMIIVNTARYPPRPNAGCMRGPAEETLKLRDSRSAMLFLLADAPDIADTERSG